MTCGRACRRTCGHPPPVEAGGGGFRRPQPTETSAISGLEALPEPCPSQPGLNRAPGPGTSAAAAGRRTGVSPLTCPSDLTPGLEWLRIADCPGMT